MYKEIIDFWFTECGPEHWWQKDEAFDALIRERFGARHTQAQAGEFFGWRETAAGCLAEIIVLDQFSRNIYRGKPESFASDPMALALAQSAVSRGLEKELSATERSFLYMPYMHSESKLIHIESAKLFESLGNQNNLDFARQHKAIIDRFGRYPHRNAILARESTPEEIEFLEEPGSSF